MYQNSTKPAGRYVACYKHFLSIIYKFIKMEHNFKSCECDVCKSACINKPGWFLYEEIEIAAEFLKVSTKYFFENYLAVDWFSNSKIDKNYYVLSPATKRIQTGVMFPYNPKGTCIFYENNKCKIYPVRPFECKSFIHTETHEECLKRHEEIAKTWETKENVIEELLDYPPYPTEPESFAEMFGLW